MSINFDINFFVWYNQNIQLRDRMKHKNKYMLPLNGKAVFVNIGIWLFVMGAVMVISDYIRDGEIAPAILIIAITTFIIFSYIKFLGQALIFKSDCIKLPQIEKGIALLYKTSVRYTNIVDVTICKRGQFGPHVKSLGLDGIIPKFVDVETLVITDKQDNQYLLSLQYYSTKQIEYIVKEIRRIANINN